MKVLLIKTSSLGDIVHTFPALTDALRAIPSLQIDWVVEEAFADIAALHPSVSRVVKVKLRQWRKRPLQFLCGNDYKTLKNTLSEHDYDYVIDAQGLIKSAWLTRLVKAPTIGLDHNSIREPLASYFYNKKIFVAKGQHAIERIRQLLAAALNYPITQTIGDFGVNVKQLTQSKSNRILFLHGTTWLSKEWPLTYWKELAEKVVQKNWAPTAAWSNETEKQRVVALAESGVVSLGRLSLIEMARHIASAKAVVSVDSGLGHLACALNIPTVFLYGPTNAALTGGYGVYQQSLISAFPCSPCQKKKCTYKGEIEATQVQPPCFTEVSPGRVMDALLQLTETPNKSASL